MDAILRLQVLCSVVVPVYVERAVSDVMQAYPLGAGGRIGHQNAAVGLRIVELPDLRLAGVQRAIFFTGGHPAVYVLSTNIRQEGGEVFDRADER